MEEKDFAGCFVMFLIVILSAGGLIACFLPERKDEVIIESKTRIIPEWKLTTDGKVIDTLFVYKQK